MLGFIRNIAPEEIYAMPLEDLGAQIQMTWAGDISCEIVMGKRWTGGFGGPNSDFATVTNLMKMIANHGWFADRLPLDPEHPFADEEIAAAAIEYHAAMKKATRAIITKHAPLVEDLRDAVLVEGELNSLQIYEILEPHGLGAGYEQVSS